MQADSPGSSSALPKLLLYLLVVMLGGALLAVPLFHLGKAAHGWLSAPSWQNVGPAKWLLSEIERAHFTRYFNRAVLVCAIALIWPFLRWVKLDRSLLPTWKPFGTGIKQWALGFALASGLLLALGFAFFKLGAYHLHPQPRWFKFGEPITAALGAGIVEEFFFRGLLLGLLLRTMSTRSALIAGTFVFALVHFLKPPEGWQIDDTAVTWSSGFLVLQQIALGFGDVQFLLAEFATLFAVGWVLAIVRMQTGALWAGIGLHGGWVFGLKYFSALMIYNNGWLPWIGANLKIGLAPLLMVLFTGWLATHLLRSR
ncbi:CPBP family glutamic-type intramembrane protease [Prosthecobacter sp.]|uniref:CPBP family glutamic-type intramembrane protease n=1 Tax=Prosthecobacter sp. TaxID=1965333 RepID=UPI001D8542E6|nr:CPBP family glutamic-type intramembrane protease [Prosthecobacter sp.]MCB1275455.1 CPBP family intramembrane metalloprotease [Prosthecobacter sp.]